MAVLGGYYWPCAQKSQQVVIGETWGVIGETYPPSGKISAQFFELFFWTHVKLLKKKSLKPIFKLKKQGMTNMEWKTIIIEAILMLSIEIWSLCYVWVFVNSMERFVDGREHCTEGQCSSDLIVPGDGTHVDHNIQGTIIIPTVSLFSSTYCQNSCSFFFFFALF